MTKREEREQGMEPPRALRTRMVSEAVVAALSDRPARTRPRVMAEAVVAAIPAEAEAEPGGGADDEAGAGA